MTTLRELAGKLQQRVKDVEHGVSQAAVETAKAILRELIDTTPVDTTTAMSNWQIGLGAPETNEIPPHVAGRFGYTQAASARVALSIGDAILGFKIAGEPIYITNNVGYIRDLNAGSSPQADPGFIERAIAKGKGKVLDKFLDLSTTVQARL